MGGQGSGKGTFAKLVNTNNDYLYIEVGQILRNMSDENIKKTINNGKFVPDDVVFNILKSAIKNNNVILDGFPRTLSQAKWLIDNYVNLFSIHIIYLNISRQEILKRIENRIKEGENRSDDKNKNSVNERINRFYKFTMPAIEWLSKNKEIKFSNIPVDNKTIEENYNSIQKVL